MKHRFKNTCLDKNVLLTECDTLDMFMSRLIKQSDENKDNWDPMVYRGDGFEALVEVLINHSPIDKRINIQNYEPWNTGDHGDDMGIDGVGISHDGKIHTVQIKFRSNTQYDLTANEDHISNFVAKTLTWHMGQSVDMTIFTTAAGLSPRVSEGMFHDKVRTLGYAEIKKLIDNNGAFWDIFRSEM